MSRSVCWAPYYDDGEWLAIPGQDIINNNNNQDVKMKEFKLVPTLSVGSLNILIWRNNSGMKPQQCGVYISYGI